MTFTSPVITSDVGSFSPLLRISATDQFETKNIIHELVGGGIAVTFGETAGTTTTLEMLFESESAANDAYTQLKTGHVFQLTDSDKPTTSMYFVVAGSVERAYDVNTADSWMISADVQEVQP